MRAMLLCDHGLFSWASSFFVLVGGQRQRLNWPVFDLTVISYFDFFRFWAIMVVVGEQTAISVRLSLSTFFTGVPKKSAMAACGACYVMMLPITKFWLA
jgi:hypothetical protein